MDSEKIKKYKNLIEKTIENLSEIIKETGVDEKNTVDADNYVLENAEKFGYLPNDYEKEFLENTLDMRFCATLGIYLLNKIEKEKGLK